MKRLGFDVRGADDVKKLLTRGYFLGENQTKAVKKALGIEELTEEQAELNAAKAVATKAARRFNTTSRLDLAGYLTVNGALLDFSEGQGYRTMDHRQISDILDLPDDHGYSDGMIEFMR